MSNGTTVTVDDGSSHYKARITRQQVGFVLIAMIIALYGSYMFQGTLGFKALTQDDIYDLFINIGVLTIVMERSLEIFITIWRGQEKIPLEKNAEMDEDRLAMVQAKFKAGDMTEDEMRAVQKQTNETKKELEGYRGETRVIAMRTSMIVGIVVSVAGFRILSSLFVTKQGGVALIDGWQLMAFNLCDILLTAGILAGGSKGLHAFSELLANFFDQSNKRLKSLGRVQTETSSKT